MAVLEAFEDQHAGLLGLTLLREKGFKARTSFAKGVGYQFGSLAELLTLEAAILDGSMRL
jgi:hypothetical protein